jgi:hypothetical protein
VRPGTVVLTPYNHYSILGTIEDLFGLERLGFGAQSALNTFDVDVFVSVF